MNPLTGNMDTWHQAIELPVRVWPSYIRMAAWLAHEVPQTEADMVGGEGQDERPAARKAGRHGCAVAKFASIGHGKLRYILLCSRPT